MNENTRTKRFDSIKTSGGNQKTNMRRDVHNGGPRSSKPNMRNTRHKTGCSSKGRKGGQVMFPTDNEARKVDVQSKDQQERVRHNKREEELTQQGQALGVANAAMNAIGRALPKLGNHPS